MLYQLWRNQFTLLKDGRHVRLDGPYDTYGVILRPPQVKDGTYLIRGSGHTKPLM
jgi:hypothetical protein